MSGQTWTRRGVAIVLAVGMALAAGEGSAGIDIRQDKPPQTADDSVAADDTRVQETTPFEMLQSRANALVADGKNAVIGIGDTERDSFFRAIAQNVLFQESVYHSIISGDNHWHLTRTDRYIDDLRLHCSRKQLNTPDGQINYDLLEIYVVSDSHVSGEQIIATYLQAATELAGGGWTDFSVCVIWPDRSQGSNGVPDAAANYEELRQLLADYGFTIRMEITDRRGDGTTIHYHLVELGERPVKPDAARQAEPKTGRINDGKESGEITYKILQFIASQAAHEAAADSVDRAHSPYTRFRASLTFRDLLEDVKKFDIIRRLMASRIWRELDEELEEFKASLTTGEPAEEEDASESQGQTPDEEAAPAEATDSEPAAAGQPHRR